LLGSEDTVESKEDQPCRHTPVSHRWELNNAGEYKLEVVPMWMTRLVGQKRLREALQFSLPVRLSLSKKVRFDPGPNGWGGAHPTELGKAF
jgi:hypothetical protein